MSHVTRRDGHALEQTTDITETREQTAVARDEVAERKRRAGQHLQQHPDLTPEAIAHGLEGLADAIVKGTTIASDSGYALKVARGYVRPAPRPELEPVPDDKRKPCPHGHVRRFDCDTCGPVMKQMRRDALRSA